MRKVAFVAWCFTTAWVWWVGEMLHKLDPMGKGCSGVHLEPWCWGKGGRGKIGRSLELSASQLGQLVNPRLSERTLKNKMESN